jgi:hypothetical protein
MDSETAERIADVSDYKGNVGFNFGITNFLNINTNLLVSGPRNRAKGDSRGKLAGYEVLDCALIIKNFIKGIEVKASVYNLLDEQWHDPAMKGALADGGDYPRERINYILEIKYKF